ncbi:YncE family protein [Rhodohalobacter mucosus]|nr:YncE family protein [Rhodohalobacter mucosus]
MFSAEAFGQSYSFYVASESEDQVSLITFDANEAKAAIDKVITVGEFPTETEGPHGLGVDPSGDYWYVSMGHGMPYGHLYKYETGTDRLITRTELGMFPASLDVSEQTGWVYVVNFNLHGDHVPSSLSVVDGESMAEIERIETGIMPHGSRLSPDGTRQYHTSMMTDELFEMDAFGLAVNRVLNLNGEEQRNHASAAMEMDHSGHPMMSEPVVKPTWASPSPNRPEVYVAGNGNDRIYVVNTDSWAVERVLESPGRGPYNLEPTPDGKKLVVSYKGEGATGIWDIETGEQLAKIKNSRMVTHGVVISPDNRYAFISVEGIGGEPGSVDIIDLETHELVDVVEVGKQAGGIAFWKLETNN